MKWPENLIAQGFQRLFLTLMIIPWSAAAAVPGEVDCGPGTGDRVCMLFSFYSLEEPQVASAAASGVTATGPYYGKRAVASLELGAAHNLPVIYTVGPRLDFNSEPLPDLGEAEQELVADVRTHAARENILAWNLANEEMRYWREGEMRWLKIATRAIRANDPFDRPVMMYEPNGRTAEAMAATTPYLDWVVRGVYANYAGFRDKRTWVRYSAEQIVAAAAVETKLPVAALWMARDQAEKADQELIEQRVQHDTYLSLVTGIRGILVFSGYNRRAGFERDFERFYKAYLEVADELNGERNLAKVFLRGKPYSGITVTQLEGPRTETFTEQERTFEYPTISSAGIHYGDSLYLFIVNSAPSRAVVSVTGLPDSGSILNARTGATIPRLDKLEIDGLGALAVRLTPAD